VIVSASSPNMQIWRRQTVSAEEDFAKSILENR
jgi:hypothetical protein